MVVRVLTTAVVAGTEALADSKQAAPQLFSALPLPMEVTAETAALADIAAVTVATADAADAAEVSAAT
jgi:hypothetical protein